MNAGVPAQREVSVVLGMNVSGEVSSQAWEKVQFPSRGRDTE